MTTRTKKRLIEVALFLGMLIIFYFFLRYITTERMPQSEGGIHTGSPSLVVV